MNVPDMKGMRFDSRRISRKGIWSVFAVAMFGGATGCVQVSAPDKPIEINLNINIRQEVVVRLIQDVRDLKEKESGVF
jgi:hypothetical protein